MKRYFVLRNLGDNGFDVSEFNTIDHVHAHLDKHVHSESDIEDFRVIEGIELGIEAESKGLVARLTGPKNG